MKVRIMRGLPGSGKSYFGSTILSRITGVDPTIVSADHFFIKDGKYTFNPRQLAVAHKVCRKKFLEALRRGDELVVVDNTNSMPTEIAFYYELANLFTDDVKILAIEPPATLSQEDWLKQCEQKNQHKVPMKSIVAMAHRMGKHKLPWYWTIKQITREDGYFVFKGEEFKV